MVICEIAISLDTDDSPFDFWNSLNTNFLNIFELEKVLLDKVVRQVYNSVPVFCSQLKKCPSSLSLYHK